MSNIIEFAGQDDTVSNLLEIASKIRSGEIVGVTVVTTTRKGVVEMNTLCVPTYLDGAFRTA